MKVLPISDTQPQFKAKIVGTQDLTELTNYLNKYVDAPLSCYNSANDLKLFKKVSDALIAFPTDAELKFTKIYRPGELYNARGIVESQYAKLTDTEPARTNSVVPILNIMKRILNPNNSEQFDKLMGNNDNNLRIKWWDEHIAPIWESIKFNFYEDTIYRRNTHPDFDYMFRRTNKV